MFYLLTSILFSTMATRLVILAHLNVFYVCVSNASDTKLHLSIALGNEMGMVCLMLLISK